MTQNILAAIVVSAAIVASAFWGGGRYQGVDVSGPPGAHGGVYIIDRYNGRAYYCQGEWCAAPPEMRQ